MSSLAICDLYFPVNIDEFTVISAQTVSHQSSTTSVASAPENGEDFSQIADDYQKFIVPGEGIFLRESITV